MRRGAAASIRVERSRQAAQALEFKARPWGRIDGDTTCRHGQTCRRRATISRLPPSPHHPTTCRAQADHLRTASSLLQGTACQGRIRRRVQPAGREARVMNRGAGGPRLRGGASGLACITCPHCGQRSTARRQVVAAPLQWRERTTCRPDAGDCVQVPAVRRAV
jgi:hypothetical protein